VHALVGACVFLALASTAAASDVAFPTLAGHPRTRLPLSVHLTSSGDAALDAAARNALADWNTVGRSALGTALFAAVDRADADVMVVVEPTGPRGPMGFAVVDADPTGMIALPVRVTVATPRPRGETPADVLFYQVLAHELGHALGLPHAADVRSLMCCARGVDLTDSAQRAAYINARRHPEVRSVERQLADHYARFWRQSQP
jgi:hypothetical protein